MTPKLTNKQQAVLDAIIEYFKTHGYSPTLRELTEMTGSNSLSAIHDYVNVLEKKGYITTTIGQHRSIQLKYSNPTLCLVVTCKDCKYRQKTFNGVAIWHVCHKLNRKTDDDFYCAYGEVKD